MQVVRTRCEYGYILTWSQFPESVRALAAGSLSRRQYYVSFLVLPVPSPVVLSQL
jgi:hypothetical protein